MSGAKQFWPTDVSKSARPSTTTEMFSRLDADLFLAHQLFRHGRPATVLEGVTVPAQRRERIRREILSAELDSALVLGAVRGSASETLAQAFLRLYHEPLI